METQIHEFKLPITYSAASMSTLMPCNSLMAFSLFVMETLNFSTCCRLLSSCCRFLSRLPCSSIRCCFIDSCSPLTFSGDWTILWLSFCPFSSAWVMASLILSCQYKCPCANKQSQIKWFQVIYMFRKLGDNIKGVMPAVQSFPMYRYLYLNKILIWKSYLQYHKFDYKNHFFMHVRSKTSAWNCLTLCATFSASLALTSVAALCFSACCLRRSWSFSFKTSNCSWTCKKENFRIRTKFNC